MEGARTLLLLLVIYVRVHDNEVALCFRMGKAYKWGKFLYAMLGLEWHITHERTSCGWGLFGHFGMNSSNLTIGVFFFQFFLPAIYISKKFSLYFFSTIWHLFLLTYLTSLLTYLLTYSLTYLLIYWLTYLLIYLTYLLINLFNLLTY